VQRNVYDDVNETSPPNRDEIVSLLHFRMRPLFAAHSFHQNDGPRSKLLGEMSVC
jgi:hypothetical protein